MRFILLILSLSFMGCSSLQKVALRGGSPVFADMSDKMALERNWEFFRDSAPANLKFLEVIYLQDTENLKLLGALIKGYAGYAYAVPETLAFGDELAGVEGSIHKQNAIAIYTKALDFGVSYFQHKGIKKKHLLSGDEEEFRKNLDEKMEKEDFTAMLFFAQSWGSLINLQKDNVALVSYVPRVKMIFDWVCEKDPKIEHGVCDMFYAQYEASRPRMLGGNPEKAKDFYVYAMNERPHHLLMRLSYVQYLILPAFDKVAFAAEEKILTEEFTKWDDLNRDSLEDLSEYKSVEHLNLFNAIAKKRFEFVVKNKHKIFEG